MDEALALVRLGDQGDKLPGQLSGGQQQRVAIARAIVVEPPLVLMDEPLSNLDAKLRLEMRAEIRRIHAMLGCSTIYVTHDQEEALSLADRIVVMIDGPDAPDRHAGGALCAARAVPMSRSSWAIAIWSNRALETVDERHGGDAWRRAADRHAGRHGRRSGRGGDPSGRSAPDAGGPIAATVEIAEYHGRDFYAVARAADGTDLYFRSDLRINPGEPVRLAASPERVLVYAA